MNIEYSDFTAEVIAKDNIRGAEVEIILSENRSFRNKVLLPRGEPENPATTEELEEKLEKSQKI